jgi:GNAT superfamily N-acetyltransferase
VLELIRIRLMTKEDIPLGMRLKEANGWNQTEADWRRYLELQPDGCFVAVLDGEPVGTTTTCVFGPVAWVAMVLVDAHCRRRGVGKELMCHALDFLDRQGVRCVRLQATPLGQPLYEKLGFVPDYLLRRYEGILPSADAVADMVPLRTEDTEDVLSFDRAVTCSDRQKLLLRLFDEFSESVRVVRRAENIEGFVATRPGARALQIGPCLATATAGRRLLQHVRYQHGGKHAFIDIPTANESAVAWAEEIGFALQRPLFRMRRGPPVDEQINEIWASSGPEMG